MRVFYFEGSGDFKIQELTQVGWKGVEDLEGKRIKRLDFGGLEVNAGDLVKFQ